MSLTLRVILILCSVIAFFMSIKKMQQSKLKMTDFVLWMFGCAFLILMSVFTGAVSRISELLGFMAPVNFVFLVIISFLLIVVFTQNIRLSQLEEKIKDIDHHIALEDKNDNKNHKEY